MIDGPDVGLLGPIGDVSHGPESLGPEDDGPDSLPPPLLLLLLPPLELLPLPPPLSPPAAVAAPTHGQRRASPRPPATAAPAIT